nr:hypothetical protein CFP56_75072 [Quercus suber]
MNKESELKRKEKGENGKRYGGHMGKPMVVVRDLVADATMEIQPCVPQKTCALIINGLTVLKVIEHSLYTLVGLFLVVSLA